MKKTSKKIIAITLAAMTAASMTACGGSKKTAETEAPVVTTEAATETAEATTEEVSETEETTEAETVDTAAEEGIKSHENGDLSWTHNTGFDDTYGDGWGYTQEELDRMQFTLDDGTRCNYTQLLDATNDENATWRGHYQKELDELYPVPIYAVQDIPESDWTPEYRDIIKPLMDKGIGEGTYMFQKDVSPLALRTIFCCTEDDLGLIDGGFANQHTLYMTDTNTGETWATFDNDDIRKHVIDGVITNAKVLMVDLFPNYSDKNGYWNQCTARVFIGINGVRPADNGKGHDFLAVAAADLVYINEKSTSYNDGQWLVRSCYVSEIEDASEYMITKIDSVCHDNNWTIYAGADDNYDFEEKTKRRDVYGSDVYATAE